MTFFTECVARRQSEAPGEKLPPSWAVVIVAETDTGDLVCWGSLAGLVVVDGCFDVLAADALCMGGPVGDLPAGAVGAAVSHSGSAEDSALVWAELWYLQGGRGLPVVFCLDAKNSKGAATAEVFAKKGVIGHVIRDLARFAEQGAHRGWEHVSGHVVGDSWNECADGVVRAASRGRLPWVQAPSLSPPSLLAVAVAVVVAVAQAVVVLVVVVVVAPSPLPRGGGCRRRRR